MGGSNCRETSRAAAPAAVRGAAQTAEKTRSRDGRKALVEFWFAVHAMRDPYDDIIGSNAYRTAGSHVQLRVRQAQTN
eukprot:6192643-Pleurochrysis_carterae.AAC.3